MAGPVFFGMSEGSPATKARLSSTQVTASAIRLAALCNVCNQDCKTSGDWTSRPVAFSRRAPRATPPARSASGTPRNRKHLPAPLLGLSERSTPHRLRTLPRSGEARDRGRGLLLTRSK